MERYFLSKSNVDKLSKYLERKLQIKNIPNARKAFKDFVYSTMVNMCDHYGDSKPDDMSFQEFIERLNKKSD